MKKILLICVLAVALCGCSKSPSDKMVNLINDTTVKINNSKSALELDSTEQATAASIVKLYSLIKKAS